MTVCALVSFLSPSWLLSLGFDGRGVYVDDFRDSSFRADVKADVLLIFCAANVLITLPNLLDIVIYKAY